MNRNLLLLITLFLISNLSFSQQIYIGQNANEIKQLIEFKVRSNNRADSYGNRSSTRKEWDVEYQNGQISDVILCYYNEYLIDMGITADFCKHFLMTDNKLSSILTQYETLSVSQLKEFYNKLSDKTKVGEFYLDNDYKNYSSIYLHNNGLATIEWTKTNVNSLPKNVRNQINSKLQKQKEEENSRILARKKEREKKEEITSKIYDFKTEFPGEYDKFIDNQRGRILSYFKDCSSVRYESSIFPSDFEIKSSKEKFYRFQSNYFVTYFNTSSSYNTSRKDSLISGIDTKKIALRKLSYSLPKLEKQGYGVRTKTTIENLTIDFTRGFTKVRIKKGELEFKGTQPLNEFKSLLADKIKNEVPEGKHFVKYEISNILGKQEVKLEIIEN